MRRSNADQMEQDLMRKDEEIEQLKKITNDVRQVRTMMLVVTEDKRNLFCWLTLTVEVMRSGMDYVH